MQDGSREITDRIDRLMSIGGRLLQRLNSSGIGDYRLPGDISRWVSPVTNELLALMPEESPEYAELVRISTHHGGSESILRPSSGDDIRKILKNLGIARQCMIASLNADWKDIPKENLVHIYFERLKQAVDYVKTELIPGLIGKEDGRTRRTAMLHIYGRIYMWTQSMAKLNQITDCLALAGCLRAILELYVDLKLIASAVLLQDVEKYFSFEQSEKWNKARNLVESRAKLSLVEIGQALVVDEFLKQAENQESNIKAMRERLWGLDRKGRPCNPKHWTNKPLVERMESLKDDRAIVELYHSSYHYCNFLVHSMYSDVTSNVNAVHLLNGHLYDLANKMFLTGTKLVNDVIGALPRERLEASLKQIEAKSFKSFFGELVKAGRGKGGQ